ncbi:uncharacterized protein LOC131650136 [Vicia villosa]|uniref:uncharacterized protein LOC131650136 n=1 Tax=Vicia villosa TaxID=3911 RepID=UPI00273C03A6|nr:uncharacterized protein LOC131650136 [Vicia villosa]
MKFFSDFHSNPVLTKGSTSSLIILVPKVSSPQSLSEYRRICLVGSLQKILSKVLAKRLKVVVDSLISSKQTTFISGRNILDGVLVVNEIIDLAKRKGRSCLILKVYYEKAYDCVCWKYLRYVLVKMGFGNRWLRWLEHCVFTSSMAVLVNGSTTSDFMARRGLRQGDPLSPLLFVIAMEGLTRLMDKAVAAGSYRGFQYGVNNSVNILHYVDDTIILGDGKLQNLWSFKAVLRGFELMSGLKINFYKSNVYGINLKEEVMQATTSFLTCSVGSLPFKFLGVMVGDSPRNIKMWKDVVQSVKNRLDVWRGRVPKAVIKELVRIQRNFLWNGLVEKKAICWVKWKDVCRVKEEGGLGIRDIEEAKVFVNDCRVLRKRDSVWCRDLVSINDSAGSRGLAFSDVVICRVKNGTKTAFWFSKWIGNQSLAEAFPELYGLAANQFMTVAEAGRWQDDVWQWEVHKWCDNVGDVEYNLLLFLETLVLQVTLEQEGEEEFDWDVNAGDGFTVKSCAAVIRKRSSMALLGEANRKKLSFIWKIAAPSKVQVLAWRMVLDRIPTISQLKRRGILHDEADCRCVFCLDHEEDSTNLFVECPVLEKIWEKVGVWIGNSISLSNLELRNYLAFFDKIKVLDERLTVGGIWLAVVWTIWNTRNSIVFRGGMFIFDDCFSAIVLSSWKWFRAVKVSSVTGNFHVWNVLPLMCIKRKNSV